MLQDKDIHSLVYLGVCKVDDKLLQGFSYALIAVAMFSKYLISIPLVNKDTITVTSGLTQIFTTYGVCNTIISDRELKNCRVGVKQQSLQR
jgi:hypothetical protein